MVSSREPRGEVRSNGIVDALLRVLPLPVVWLDPDGRVLAATPAAGQCFALAPESLVGLEAEALANPAAAVSWRELLARVMAGEKVGVDRSVFPSGSNQREEHEGRNGRGGGNHNRVTGASESGVGFVLAPLRGAGRENLGAVLYEDVTELRGIGEMLLDVNRELRNLVRADALTGLANRREYERLLRTEVARAARTRSPLSLLMIDVDEFKAFNDELGHQAGDRCLAAVAAALRSGLLRPADAIARYGGEEFVALLPGTDGSGARLLAERLRRAVERLAIPHPRSRAGLIVTVSVGVATAYPVPGYDGRQLQEAADRGLYLAKDGGRNQVRVVDGSASVEPPPPSRTTPGAAEGS